MVLPVVVCQGSSSGKSGRKLSIDSNGTIDMFLHVENLEENSAQVENLEENSVQVENLRENSVQVENPGDARFIASVCASLKTRKTLELKKKMRKENRKEKEKRSSISSEGTIVEDLVLSGGQSLSENMQETEDFSEKNEYLAAATPSAPPIFHNNAESKCKAFQIRNFTDDSENVEIHCLKEAVVKNTGGESLQQNGKESAAGGSNVDNSSSSAPGGDKNLLIAFLGDEKTSSKRR